MHTVKGRENGSNTFGEGWRAFSPTFPPQNARFGGIWGGAGGAVVGEEEGKKGRVGEKGLPRAHDIGLVAQVHAARQACPRHRPPGAALARAASMATLSRHMHWRDKGYLSRRGRWRDQTGYFLQIKTNTG